MFSPLTHDDPHQLGAYRLVARLGSGGMGTVYLARSATGRTVALKTMHARIATDPAFRTRFRLETDAARIIGPVHGARVFDADPLAEIPWLATEYVLGPPLDEAVSLAGPLPEPAVRALGVLLCAALAQLHASDVVHRDLKPSNIMLTADGPKVIDFGIARAIGDDRLTRAGAAAGTPAFMSPEQASGQEHTPAGDVFALAGVLVYAATGRGPFGSGQPADLLYRVRYADPDLTGLPPDLLPVLLRCLGKNAADRPTTTELAAWLGSGHGTGFSQGQGDFAGRLPDSLLADIARRVGDVWHVRQRRLPVPPDHAVAETGTSPSGAPSGLSRRTLLAFGGGSVLAAAAAGAGAWAWLGRQDGASGKPSSSGKPVAAPDRTTWDVSWQVPRSSYSDPRILPVPLVLDGLLVVGENGVQGLDPLTGKRKWPEFPEVYFLRRMATDGERIYAADYTLEETDPLTVSLVDPADGTLRDPFVELKDLRAILYGTQLLCATSDALYLTGGRGPHRKEGFGKDQTFFLLGVSTSGDTLWKVPLPARPDKSEHLHFLSARVVGEYLVLVQQSSDGEPRLVVRDALTGGALWERPLDIERTAVSRAHLAVDDRHVYPAAGELLALSLADGKVAWRFDEGRPGARYSPPAVKDGVVYAVEEGGGTVAVDAATGALRWAEKVGVGKGGAGKGGAATVADLDTPPVAGDAYVYRKAASGLVAADIRTGASSRPFKAAGAEYVAHEPARRLIALGEQHIAAYPLA